jgi:hypothetical protein
MANRVALAATGAASSGSTTERRRWYRPLCTDPVRPALNSSRRAAHAEELATPKGSSKAAAAAAAAPPLLPLAFTWPGLPVVPPAPAEGDPAAGCRREGPAPAPDGAPARLARFRRTGDAPAPAAPAWDGDAAAAAAEAVLCAMRKRRVVVSPSSTGSMATGRTRSSTRDGPISRASPKNLRSWAMLPVMEWRRWMYRGRWYRGTPSRRAHRYCGSSMRTDFCEGQR